MVNMTRPPGDVPRVLNAAMHDIAARHDLTLGEMYERAARIVVHLDPHSEYDPPLDDVSREFIDLCLGDDDGPG